MTLDTAKRWLQIRDYRYDSIRDAKAKYDAILIDVDNGPEGLVRDSNELLYSLNGIKAARKALRSRGVLAIWASGYHQWFTDRIRKSGFDVTEERVRARRDKGARRTIWVAWRS